MAKFLGSIDTLKDKVKEFGLTGNWTEKNGINKFTTLDGGMLALYSNGTLLCQGKVSSKNKIETFIKEMSQNQGDKTVITSNSVSNVFVVYGHDESSRDQLELILNKCGIEPFILAKNSGNGLTIIEALESQVGKDGVANVGIVLLTPDDFGYSKREGEKGIKGRARQNVILEMGMLMSKLGRSHTIILIKGEVERPSDTDGIIYHAYNNHVKEIGLKLIDRLEACGFAIDHKKALAALK